LITRRHDAIDSARLSTTSDVSLRPTLRLGSMPPGAEHDLLFLQQRLALYGAVVATLSGLFLLVRAVALVTTGRNYLAEPGRPAHIAATLFALGLWLVARRRRPYSITVLNWLDRIATTGLGLLFALMAYAIPGGNGTLVGILAVSFVTLGRAAQVPSSPQQTLVLTALAFSFVFVSAVLAPIPAQYLNTVASRGFAILDPLVWCIAGTALSTVTSRVIYGLQEKVIEARQLGQYTLEEKIGQGGMGEIYRARHAMLRRPTAIKLLPGDHSEEQLRRFEREVQLTALLSHPNTICIFDYGRTPEGTFYYAMELLHGLNLERMVEQYPVQAPGRVVNWLIQVCGALGEAHRVGLIHRDLKPANIFLCQRGGIDDFVKVLDFGLVRQVQPDSELTQTNTQLLVGTPLYMSPEAIVAPERVDARADLYSLGVTAYHLLTGSPPFSGSSLVEVCGHHLHSIPEPPSQRLGRPLPASLERLVLSCLAKSPAERPTSADAVAAELQKAVDIPRYAASEADRWWREEFAPSPPRSSIGTQKTMHIALSERLPERTQDLPKAG
jgi:serine/threonine protein kinase